MMVRAIVANAINEKPTPPTTVRDTVPPHMEDAVSVALARLPAAAAGRAATLPVINQ